MLLDCCNIICSLAAYLLSWPTPESPDASLVILSPQMWRLRDLELLNTKISDTCLLPFADVLDKGAHATAQAQVRGNVPPAAWLLRNSGELSRNTVSHVMLRKEASCFAAKLWLAFAVLNYVSLSFQGLCPSK